MNRDDGLARPWRSRAGGRTGGDGFAQGVWPGLHGAVSFAGKVLGVSVSGSSQLVDSGDGWCVTLYAPAKTGFVSWCQTIAVTFEFDGNVVTDVTME